MAKQALLSSLFALLTACYATHGRTDAGTDASPPIADPLPWCNAAGFCWEAPRPQGNDLRAIHGVSPNAVIAVGDYGTALRFDGSSWSRIALSSKADLDRVRFLNTNDIWVSGNTNVDALRGELVHIVDGRSTEVPLPGEGGIRGLSQSPSGDVYFGQGATVYQGSSAGFDAIFELGTGIGVFDVLALSESDIWVVAWEMPTDREPSDLIYHFDGTEWTEVARALGSTYPYSILGMDTTSDGTVWAYGFDLYRWTGTTFELVDTSTTPAAEISSLWGTSPDDLWLSGFSTRHFDGESWSAEECCRGAIWGADDGGLLFRVGGHGAIDRYDGRAFRAVEFPPSDVLRPLDPDAWGRIPVELWAEGARAAWGLSPDAVWRIPESPPPRDNVERWDGERWLAVLTQDGLRDIHGTSENNIWVVGTGSSIARRTEGGWIDQSAPPGSNLFAVHTAGPDATWVVGLRTSGAAGGGGPVIHRWNGSEWESPVRLPSSAGFSFTDVDGRGEDDVFFLGEGVEAPLGRYALLFHFDGESYRDVEAPGFGFTWEAVSVDEDANLSIVVDDTLHERRGGTWSEAEFGIPLSFGRRRHTWNGATGTWVFDQALVVRRP